MRPWVHVVPVDAHWADLRERLGCLRKRDALAARVAAEGRRLAQALSTDAALCFAWNVLQRASRLAPAEKPPVNAPWKWPFGISLPCASSTAFASACPYLCLSCSDSAFCARSFRVSEPSSSIGVPWMQ